MFFMIGDQLKLIRKCTPDGTGCYDYLGTDGCRRFMTVDSILFLVYCGNDDIDFSLNCLIYKRCEIRPEKIGLSRFFLNKYFELSLENLCFISSIHMKNNIHYEINR